MNEVGKTSLRLSQEVTTKAGGGGGGGGKKRGERKATDNQVEMVGNQVGHCERGCRGPQGRNEKGTEGNQPQTRTTFDRPTDHLPIIGRKY